MPIRCCANTSRGSVAGNIPRLGEQPTDDFTSTSARQRRISSNPPSRTSNRCTKLSLTVAKRDCTRRLVTRYTGTASNEEVRTTALAFVEVAPTGTAEAKHALALGMSDFEDAMQAAAAVQAGVDFIVTRNTGDYGSAPIPAITPDEFLAYSPP